MYPSVKFKVFLPLAAVCALAVATVAGADGGKAPSPQAAPPRPQALAAAAAPESGAEPATGRFRRPTPAEVETFLRGLAPFFAKSQESLVVQQGAHGLLALDLSGRFPSTAIATTQADGTLSWTCISNLAEAAAVLADPPVLEER